MDDMRLRSVSRDLGRDSKRPVDGATEETTGQRRETTNPTVRDLISPF